MGVKVNSLFHEKRQQIHFGIEWYIHNIAMQIWHWALCGSSLGNGPWEQTSELECTLDLSHVSVNQFYPNPTILPPPQILVFSGVISWAPIGCNIFGYPLMIPLIRSHGKLLGKVYCWIFNDRVPCPGKQPAVTRASSEYINCQSLLLMPCSSQPLPGWAI